MNFYVITKKSIIKITMFGFFLLAAYIWFSFQAAVIPANQLLGEEKVREIHMVTGEFASTTESGKKIESYRFDPGTVYLKKGERVHLKIYGVNGEEHPFIIEGTDIQGTVRKGNETVVPLQFEEAGTYRLICITHQDSKSNGPMIAYIVVE